LNHHRPNTDMQKRYGIAFGEAVSTSSPPSRSQIRGGVTCYRLTESGFGGWADEKIKTAHDVTQLLGPKRISSTTFDNISLPAAVG